MAHNRTTQYSAPYRRNNLLGLQQYAASEHFPSLGRWDKARPDDLYVIRSTVGRNHPVHITVVGVVSSDKAHLESHGNYHPTYMPLELIGRKAKLQFVISPPVDDPDFAADYALALERLKAIQEDVAGSPKRREHFIEGESMKLNFNLFTKKEPAEMETGGPGETAGSIDGSENGGNDSDDDSSEREDGEIEDTPAPLPAYEVASQYRHAWETVSATHHNNYLQVWGVNESLVDYRQLHKHLVSGTTVVVEFTLKHFSIRERGSRNIESDTYTANLVSVSILREAEKISRQPSTSTPKRRPVPVSQTPSRQTLKFAADTFSPVRTQVASSSKPSSKTRGMSSPTPVASSSSSTASPIVKTDSITRQKSSSVVRTGNVPLVLSQELIDQLLPYILGRIKGNTDIDAPVTPDRHRSFSPTLSTSSGGSTVGKRGIDDGGNSGDKLESEDQTSDLTDIDDEDDFADLGSGSAAGDIGSVNAESTSVIVEMPAMDIVEDGSFTTVNEQAIEGEDAFQMVEAELVTPSVATTVAGGTRSASARSKSSSSLQDKREGKRRRS